MPRIGANPYLFEPFLPEGVPLKDKPVVVNPAIQDRPQVLIVFFFNFSLSGRKYNHFRTALIHSEA